MVCPCCKCTSCTYISDSLPETFTVTFTALDGATEAALLAVMCQRVIDDLLATPLVLKRTTATGCVYSHAMVFKQCAGYKTITLDVGNGATLSIDGATVSGVSTSFVTCDKIVSGEAYTFDFGFATAEPGGEYDEERLAKKCFPASLPGLDPAFLATMPGYLGQKCPPFEITATFSAFDYVLKDATDTYPNCVPNLGMTSPGRKACLESAMNDLKNRVVGGYSLLLGSGDTRNCRLSYSQSKTFSCDPSLFNPDQSSLANGVQFRLSGVNCEQVAPVPETFTDGFLFARANVNASFCRSDGEPAVCNFLGLSAHFGGCPDRNNPFDFRNGADIRCSGVSANYYTTMARFSVNVCSFYFTTTRDTSVTVPPG